MDGNYTLPNGAFMNEYCQHCYFKHKVKSQKGCIINSQDANRRYKLQIQHLENALEQKDRRIESLRKDNRDWYKVFNSLPSLIKRWVWWRYSRMS